MAMQSNSGGSRGRMVSEINVTPLVDVMLVLLIIFMVAAPMMIQGIDVKLPATSAQPLPAHAGRLAVSITADRRIYLNDEEVVLGELGARLSAVYQNCGDQRGVILRADQKVEYGFVAQVMGVIREARIDQIGMVTEPLTGSGRDAEQ